MEVEIWKPVVGYEDLYEVSNLGRIKSLERQCSMRDNLIRKVPETILKQMIDKHGYYRVGLNKDGVRKCGNSVHRLVAEAFIPNPGNLPFINHKDENPLNNCVDNLEWCTPKYNRNYGSCSQKLADKLNKPVGQYTREWVLITTYPSVKDAALKIGHSSGNIIAVCLKYKGHKSAYGYYWKYLD